VWSIFNKDDKSTILGLFLMNASDPKFNTRWICPEYIGKITITSVPETLANAQGPRGVITFIMENNKTGSFDVESKKWTIDKLISGS
jgi:hypothetical protein